MCMWGQKVGARINGGWKITFKTYFNRHGLRPDYIFTTSADKSELPSKTQPCIILNVQVVLFSMLCKNMQQITWQSKGS